MKYIIASGDKIICYQAKPCMQTCDSGPLPRVNTAQAPASERTGPPALQLPTPAPKSCCTGTFPWLP